MIIIALLTHFSACFGRYSSRKKLAHLSHNLRKDLGIQQDSFESEVAKATLFTLIKELSTLPKAERSAED